MDIDRIVFTVPGTPVGKGRARSVPLMRDGAPVIGKGNRPVVKHYTPAKTVSYENLVKFYAQQAMQGRAPLQCAVAVVLKSFVTPPASWSKRKKERALAGEIFPEVKPDFDNIQKIMCDAVNKIVWDDDKRVCDVVFRKRYDSVSRVVMGVKPL